MTAPAPPARIGPLDTFRCLTVTFALVSHALLEFGVQAVTPAPVWLALRSVTRASTPGLLVLFGVMAEVVYARRYQSVGGALRPRLYHRAFQCYVAFVALAALVVVARPEPAGYLLASLVYGRLEGYNVIFALYSFLLLALAGLLPVRARWGFGGLAAVFASVWAVDAALRSLPALPSEPVALRVLGDVTFGLGRVWGPSAWHALSLVVAGMAFGHVLYVRPRRRDAVALAAVVVAVAAVLVGVEVAEVGVVSFFERLVDLGQYRARNHPAYYAYGVLASLPLVGLAYGLHAVAPRPLGTLLHALGSKTFSYFLLGNALLIAIPDHGVRSRGEAVALIVGCVAAAGAFALLWAAFSRRTGIGAAFQKRTQRLFAPQSAALSTPSSPPP